VTFGKSAADGGGTRASPVMRMGLRKEAQNGQKGEALKAAVDRKDNDAGQRIYLPKYRVCCRSGFSLVKHRA
jgi:hypothetical protein